jgi:hypothetical protein
MTSLLEIHARAALCRQLAKREPNSKSLWLAEAERWSHLAQDEMPCHAVRPMPTPDHDCSRCRAAYQKARWRAR